MSEAGRTDPLRRTAAIQQKSRWPGWIWAVPIAAIGICAWLAVRELSSTGITITLRFDDAAGMKTKDTKVVYRGLEIGQVTDIFLARDLGHVVAKVDIDTSVEDDLNTGTRFYLKGARVSLSDLSSLKSIVSGPTIEMVPGIGEPTREFAGIDGAPPLPLAVSVPYRVTFDGDAGGLKSGSPVTLHGFTVGEVKSTQLATDPKTGTITTPVLLALDPTRFHFAGGGPSDGNWRKLLDATLAKLIGQGMRARLTQSPPLIGAQQVALDMTADKGNATLAMGEEYPEIPTASSGGGIESVVDQLGNLPVAQIGDNVKAITDHIDTLVSGPQLKDTIDHLDQSVAVLDRTLQAVGPQIGPTIKSLHETVVTLRATAKEIDATAAALKSMSGGSPASPNGNLQQAMAELTQAGRAVRTLADYLDQHPEALLKGRDEK
jgi:paraquat-inducible protein B